MAHSPDRLPLMESLEPRLLLDAELLSNGSFEIGSNPLGDWQYDGSSTFESAWVSRWQNDNDFSDPGDPLPRPTDGMKELINDSAGANHVYVSIGQIVHAPGTNEVIISGDYFTHYSGSNGRIDIAYGNAMPASLNLAVSHMGFGSGQSIQVTTVNSDTSAWTSFSQTVTLPGVYDYVAVRFDAGTWTDNPAGWTDQYIALDNFSMLKPADVTAPDAITDLTVTGQSDTSLTLGWTATGDDGATGQAAAYDIRYSTVGPITDANWDTAAQVASEPAPAMAGSAESMEVTGLTGGTTYYFAVKAIDEEGNPSPISNSPSDATLVDTTDPGAVTDLAAGSPTTNSLQLSWTATGDDGLIGQAVGYDLRYRTDGPVTDLNWDTAVQAAGEPTPGVSGASESMPVTGLDADTTYYFALRAIDEVGNESALSNVATITTDPPDTTAPSAVSDLAVTAATPESITLSWTAPGDDGAVGTATSYEVRYLQGETITDANWDSAITVVGEPTPQASGAAETFTVTGLDQNLPYSFAIKAADEANNTSAISNPAEGDTEGLNLLVNGDWETGDDTGWNAWEIRLSSVETSPVYEGAYALTMINTDPSIDGGGFRSFQTVELVRGATYTYSSQFRLDSAASQDFNFYLNVRRSQWSDLVASTTHTAVNGQWTDVSMTFTPPVTGEYYIWFGTGGGGEFTAYLDDLQLIAAGGTDMVAPGAITDLAAGNPSNGSVDLTWTATGDDGSTGTATKYDVRYSTAGPITDANWDSASQAVGEPAPQASGAAETFTVTGLNDNTQYYFAVKALDEGDLASGVSNSPSETTLVDTDAPAAVSDLTAAATGPESVLLEWTAVGDDANAGTATSYDIRYSTAGPITDANWASASAVTGELAPRTAGSAEQFTVTGLSPNQTYWFAMTVADEKPNASDVSNSPAVATEALDTTGPAVVSDLSASDPSASSILLSWSAVGDDGLVGTAASYDLRYRTDGPVTDANWDTATSVVAEPTPQASGLAESMRVGGLSASTSYYFGLKVIDEGGNASTIAQAGPTATAAEATNLLTNPSFESQLTGWESPGASLVAGGAHEGIWSIQLDNADAKQTITTVPGQTYKLTAWAKITAHTGQDWGGFRIEALDKTTWTGLAQTPYYSMSALGSEWKQVAIRFTATSTTTQIAAGYEGGSGQAMTIQVDDTALFAAPATNSAPEIYGIVLTPETVSGLPTTQTYEVLTSDVDGAIDRIVWDFGDGTRSFDASGTRYVAAPGSYSGTVTVIDDDGAMSSFAFTWSAEDATFPDVSIDATPAEVTTDQITLTGSASGANYSIFVSTDRGVSVDATGTYNWSALIDLEPGYNRIMVQVTEADGDMTTLERVVRYNPAGALAVSNVTADGNSVEKYKTIELTFDVDNSAATHPQFPYEATPPAGLEWVDGATVEAVFWHDSDPGTLYRQPAFVYHDYDMQLKSGEQWLNPIGEQVWKVRFAPQTEGLWHYRIEVTEAKGSAQSAEGTFDVTAAVDPDNHGPIVVSQTDSRYFEYADGTPFIGSGHGIGRMVDAYNAIDRLDSYGVGNQNLFRWWTAGDLWGSSFGFWQSMTLGPIGNAPDPGLTTNSAYADGLVSLKLDATNPIMYQSANTVGTALIPGETYVMRIRWRTENVTGPTDPAEAFGATVKFTGYPTVGNTSGYAAVMAHEAGTTPWHVSEATFLADQNFITGGVSIILENADSGTVYVDEITIQQVKSDGSLGENVLPDPNFNTHEVFDPRQSFTMDHILEAAEDRNMVFKMLVEEKGDWLLSRLADDGLPSELNAGFYGGEGSATEMLHTWFWRYLVGRFGSSQAIMAWELVNEGNPGPGAMFRLTNELADYVDDFGSSHLVSTSTWATLAENAWNDPAYSEIDHADFHAYIYGSGWIQPEDQLGNDTSRFFEEYGQAVIDAGFNKPTVWSELGIHEPDGGSEEADLALDTDGVWLHKFLWAGTGPSGVYPIYWYTDNIENYDLSHVFNSWHTFMADVPITNGLYEDVAASNLDANLRVMGQKDTTNGRAHVWFDNATHTWRNVVDGVSATAVNDTVEIDMGAAHANASFRVTWHDTSTGLAGASEIVAADSFGTVALNVSGLLTDSAAKIEIAPLPGDGNGDGSVDDADYTIWADNYGQAVSSGDYNGDGTVDDADYTIWADNYGATLAGGTGGGSSEDLLVAEQTNFVTTAAPLATTEAESDLQPEEVAWGVGSDRAARVQPELEAQPVEDIVPPALLAPVDAARLHGPALNPADVLAESPADPASFKGDFGAEDPFADMPEEAARGLTRAQWNLAHRGKPRLGRPMFDALNAADLDVKL